MYSYNVKMHMFAIINMQFGDTALSLASQFGHVEIVKMLLHHHADVSIRNKVYTTLYACCK